jgi:hypothetical protein
MPKPRSKDRPIWQSHMLCQALGISSGELGRKTLDGTIQGKVRYGQYDAITAIKSYVDHLTDELARSDQTDDEAIKGERLRWFRTRSDMADLEIAARRRDLLPGDMVERAWSNVILASRTRLLAIPSKLATRLGLLASPAAIENVLEVEINAALNELSQVEIDGKSIA